MCAASPAGKRCSKAVTCLQLGQVCLASSLVLGCLCSCAPGHVWRRLKHAAGGSCVHLCLWRLRLQMHWVNCKPAGDSFSARGMLQVSAIVPQHRGLVTGVTYVMRARALPSHCPDKEGCSSAG